MPFELCPGSRNEIFSDLENIAVESMSTYSPFSVSFLITLMLLSSGREESMPDMEAGDMDSSDMRERYVFSYRYRIDFIGSGCIFLRIT